MCNRYICMYLLGIVQLVISSVIPPRPKKFSKIKKRKQRFALFLNQNAKHFFIWSIAVDLSRKYVFDLKRGKRYENKQPAAAAYMYLA
jgi:hypothetical protein